MLPFQYRTKNVVSLCDFDVNGEVDKRKRVKEIEKLSENTKHEVENNGRAIKDGETLIHLFSYNLSGVHSITSRLLVDYALCHVKHGQTQSCKITQSE